MHQPRGGLKFEKKLMLHSTAEVQAGVDKIKHPVRMIHNLLVLSRE